MPDQTPNGNTVHVWQTVFKRRRAWAIGLADGSRNTTEKIHELDEELGVINKAIEIAVENIRQHVGNLQPKYKESKAWADQVYEDQAFLLDHWQDAIQMLGSIKAYRKLCQCLRVTPARVLEQSAATNLEANFTLQNVISLDEVKRAASHGDDLSRQFSERVRDVNSQFEDVVIESKNMIENFQQSMKFSGNGICDQGDKLMEEIDVIAKKITADCEHVFVLTENPKSLSQTSKIAHLHKENFLPSLLQTNEEINQVLAEGIQRKEQAMQTSAQFLQEIAIVESIVSAIHTNLGKLDIEKSDTPSFDVLNFVIKLPSLYGSLLVECVKRQEWADKMTADSSSLVEELATFKDDEAKRRKRWVKDMGGTVDLGMLDDMALGIEVNVHSQKQDWPAVSRSDIDELIQRLRELGDLDGAIKEIEEYAKTLDIPSKQQARRAKAFKNGSVHEAAYGRTSLLLRGDDEVVLAMRNDKSRVEDKLKSAESRVRKLEDLLHRQSQPSPFSRPPSAAGPPAPGAPTFERHITAPVTNFSSALSKARETGSRRSSFTTRRLSATNDAEEKGLTQRVVSLEAELTTEKIRSAELAKNVAARSNAEDLLKSQVREAISTKEDLLGNLEAQQREFDDDRRLLHEENNKLKVQLDQLEDEFDRVLDNREHEDRTHALEEELKQARMDAASEIDLLNCQKDALSKDFHVQHDQLQEMDDKIRLQKQDNADLSQRVDNLSIRLQDRDHAQLDHHRTLRATLLHLSPEENVPDDFAALTNTVEAVAEKSVAHLNDLKNALDSLQADNSALEIRNKAQDDEVYDLRERLGTEERQVLTVREEHGILQTQHTNLETQLASERNEHDQLRTRSAAIEVDSNAFRERLVDEESMTADLSSKIANYKLEHQSLEDIIAQREAKVKLLQKIHDDLSSSRSAQTSRVHEVSKMLLSQNFVLQRLLEQIGLTVTREEEKMVIQKIPRAASSSAILADPSTSMKRSLSIPMPSQIDQNPPTDPEVVDWANAETVDEVEKRFEKFLRETKNIDIDVFSEAVHKRVKEIEHIARKWQKEARAYRDKSHRAQGEAHDRIALRNFKEGDLALFLPTRDQATKPWAAFNVGAPHCFLREQDSHNLSKRDWLIARISKVEERVVDLSKSINGGLKGSGDQRVMGDKSNTGAFPNDENPYELSDGLRWYLIDAAEEKPGAPINVGTGKVTVASANVDAKGSSIRMSKKSLDANAATKTLTRSLDSRRSSSNSKKSLVGGTINAAPAAPASGLEGMLEQSIDNAAAAAAASTNLEPTKNTPHSLQEIDRPRSSQTLNAPAPSNQGTEHDVRTLSAPNQ